MTAQLRPALAYVRVSTERQAGEVFSSLGDQRTAIATTAARLHATVVETFADEGASGATIEKRPAFLAMLAYCEAHRRARSAPGFVVCLNDSRFGRFPNPDQAAALRYRLDELGWVVRFAESDDSEDITSRSIMRALGAAEATKYRQTIRANAKRGARGAAEQGFWVASAAPLGYRRRVVYPAGRERTLEHGVRKASDEKVSLTIGPDAEAEAVRWLFATYAAGTTTTGAIVTELRKRVPGRRWSSATMTAVLRNPAYAGDVVWGRKPMREDGRQKSSRVDPSLWYGKRDAHPALVPRALFAAVQARLAERRKLGQGASRVAYPLTGLVTCATCGRPLASGGSARHVTVRGVVTHVQFYACSIANARDYWPARAGARDDYTPGLHDGPPPVCPGKLGTVTRHLLEPAVIATVAAVTRSRTVRRAIEAAIADALADRDGTADAAARAVTAKRRDARLRTLETQRARLVAAIAAGTLTATDAAPEMAAMRAEIATLTAERDAARAPAVRPVDAAAERARFVALAHDFPTTAAALLAMGDGLGLRELLRPWIAAAAFDKHTRVLTMTMRTVPEIGTLALGAEKSAGAGFRGTQRTTGRTITRRVPIGPKAVARFRRTAERAMRGTR